MRRALTEEGSYLPALPFPRAACRRSGRGHGPTTAVQQHTPIGSPLWPPPRRAELLHPERYDRLSPSEIGRGLRERLEAQKLQLFPPSRFAGAGLYALYYRGALPLYAPLVADARVPIYLGKAEAGNSRLGDEPNYDADKLWKRIVKHSRSIEEVVNCDERPVRPDNFLVRYLPVDDAWIVSGEHALLRECRPVLGVRSWTVSDRTHTWHHAPQRAVWDTLHPRRARAGAWPNRKRTLDEMLARGRARHSHQPDD